MTFTATPEPFHLPPRIRLEFDTDNPSFVFNELTVTRDGSQIREQPILGGSESFAYDYEAPFGTPVHYDVTGTYIEPAAPDWTESWASLAAWTGDTADWSTGGGAASSAVIGADIERSASGEIQSVSVDDPRWTRFELVDASGVTVVSLSVEDKVRISGTGTPMQANGGGSFSLLLSNGIASATGDSGWSVSTGYAGVPEKVRLVSRGRAYEFVTSFTSAASSWSPRDVYAHTDGYLYVTDLTNKVVRKINATTGVETVGSGFPISTVGEPRGVVVDGSNNIYAVDYGNKRVRKFNSSGVALTDWGTTEAPFGIAINPTNGNVHICRNGGGVGEIRRYTNTGSAVGSAWAKGTNLRDIVVDSAGNTYVTDGTADTIYKLNGSGTTTGTFPAGVDIRGIDLDGDLNIFVTCSENYTVRKFSPAGALVTEFSSLGRGYGLSFDASGDLWVAEYTLSTLRKYDAVDASVGEIVVTPLGVEGDFDGALTVTIDSEDAWLIHPTAPSLSVSIDPGPGRWSADRVNVAYGTQPTMVRQARRYIHEPIGRRMPVVITNGSRRAADWTLLLDVFRSEDRGAVEALIDDQSPLLLRSPVSFGWDLPDGWYSVGDVTFDRRIAALQYQDRRITLQLTPVDEPVVRRGATSRTWADVFASFGTWQNVRASNDTWLDTLAG